MNRRWVVAGTAALVVGALTHRGRGRALDDRVYRAVNRGHGPGADAFFGAITELGSILASTGAAVAVATSGRRREAADALGAAGAMWLVGQGTKRLILRPRPYHALPNVRLMIGEPRGTSWPSSHPAVLLAFLTVLGRDLDAPAGLRAALAASAALVGASRVYLGVHYPADVIGGMLMGRGVADLWSTAVSPVVVGRIPSPARPG